MSLAERLVQLKDYQGEDRVISSEEYQEILAQQPGPPKFYSDMPGLDAACDGFEGGELVVISGPRKAGKTLLAQSLTMNFSQQNIKGLWFSYELTAKQFMKRFPTRLSFQLPMKLKAHALDWLEDRIIEGVAKYGISVVFIDHLHFLFDMAKARNASIEIGTIIRRLKSIAIELNLVFFVMCHTRMIENKDKNEKVQELDDSFIRDSSFVSQESDCGLIIWRVRNTENKACLKVCYHRRTGTWEKVIRLIKVEGRLRELLD